MAVIHRMRDMAQYRAELEKISQQELILQQICQRGAIDVLEALLEIGASEQTAKALLQSVQSALHTLHEVAQRRGVILWSYTE